MSYLSLHKLKYSTEAPLESRLGVGVYKTQGIIIKKADLSDADRLLTVYTKKQGKILVRAKGIGKKESKLKSLIEPFNLYEFLLAKSKTIDVLTNVWSQKEFIYLRQNLENLALAIYFAELVDKLVVAPERDDKIWALLVRAMEVLDNLTLTLSLSKEREKGEVDLNKLKTAFEEKLLEFLGHPSFKMRHKVTIREKNNYLQSLIGEPIKSTNFLRSLSLIR